jgi:hypothetical protein
MVRALALVTVLLSVGVVSAETGASQDIDRVFAIPPGSDLEVRLEVGELRVESAPVDEVRVEVSASCRPASSDKCRRRLERIAVESESLAVGTSVRVVGVSKRYSKMDVRARVVVPESSPLAVSMYAGEIRVEGGGQDLAVRLKYGEVDVHQPLDRTRSVVADANIGDSRIYAAKGQPDSSRPFLVGSKVTWDEGPGEAEVTVKLSAGDITIRLD